MGIPVSTDMIQLAKMGLVLFTKELDDEQYSFDR